MEEQPKPGRSWIAYGLVSLAVLLAGIFYLLDGPIFANDDAYITLHNAQVLHWGHDPNYVGVSALAGSTSPVHLLLVSSLLFVLSPLSALIAAAWIGITLFVLGAVRMCLRLGAHWSVAVLLALTGALTGYVPHQLVNGLETGLAMAAIVWGISFCLDDSPRAVYWLGAIFGLMPWIRPELSVVAAGLLVVRAIRPTAQPDAPKRSFLPVLFIAGAICLAFMAWCMLALGEPFPTTAMAKRAFFAEDQWPVGDRAVLVRNAIGFFIKSLWPLGFGFLALPFFRAGWIGIVLIAAMIGGHLAYFPTALQAWEFRYLTILVPFAIAGLAVFSGSVAKLRLPLGLVCAIVAGLALYDFPLYWGFHRSTASNALSSLKGVADWANQTLEPNDRVLIHDAGYIAYGTRLHLTDLVGLKTPWVTEVHRRFKGPDGRERAIAEIAEKAKPTVLIVQSSWLNEYGIRKGLEDAGWKLTPLAAISPYEIFRLSKTSP